MDRSPLEPLARAASRATELHARPSDDFPRKLAETQALLRRAADDYSPVTQASSLGAEDVVITHLINALALPVEVFVLETGALHTETLQLLERLQAHSQAPIRLFRPEPAPLLQFVREQGQDAIYRDIDLRKRCCAIRKTEPLARALAGKRVWITGLRREQSAVRAEVELFEETVRADSGPIAQINPLAKWTQGDVWHYIAQNRVDYNPLHDRFFPSIGCAPCTRAISVGEDIRAGRWWWESDSAKECGLHVREAEGARA